MMDFSTLTQIFLDYGYVIMFIASYVEGGLSMLAGGFLASLGYFNLVGVVTVMFLGDFLSDIMWYGVGYYGGSRILKKVTKVFAISDERVEKIKEKLKDNAGKILIGVKLTTGLCLATMITSGTVKLKLKRFLFFDSIGSILWSAGVVVLGYFFGSSYSFLNSILKWSGIILVIMLVVVYYFISKKSIINNNH